MKQFISQSFRLFAFTLLSSLFMMGSLDAQESQEPFVRKNRILIETGYNIIAGFSNSSGVNVFYDFDGETITTLGLNGGYFVSENFALKANLGILSSNGSLTNFGIGAKYYIGGSVPVEFGAGFLSTGGDSVGLANLGVGYAISLADNIALEPALTLIINDNGGLMKFGVNFAMFL